MNYTNKEEIKIGDLIWENEGTSVKRVVKILDSKRELSDFGLENPSIICSCDILGNDDSPFVAIAQNLFEEDGTEPLTSYECLLMNMLCKMAGLQNNAFQDQKDCCSIYLPPVKIEKQFCHPIVIHLYRKLTSEKVKNLGYYLLDSSKLELEEITLEHFDSLWEYVPTGYVIPEV